MFSLSRPSDGDIAALLAEAERQEPAYEGVGTTAETMPAGYRQRRYQLHVGHGPAIFARAVRALDSWQAPRSIGTIVTPAAATPTTGTTIVQCIPLGPLWALAPCRIVYRVEEPDRVGFAYGSLDAHPVRGEEAFVVEQDAAGVVRARITVFSRPNHWLVRLGGPVGWLVQRRTARAYLAGIRDAALI